MFFHAFGSSCLYQGVHGNKPICEMLLMRLKQLRIVRVMKIGAKVKGNEN